MAEGDIIMSRVVDGAPSFPCGGCNPCDLGDTLEMLFSGLTTCVGCVAPTPGPGQGYSLEVNALSLTGPYTLTKTAPNTWTVTGVGSYDITWYTPNFSFADCFSGAQNETGTFNLSVHCNPTQLPENRFDFVSALLDTSGWAAHGWPGDSVGAFFGAGGLDSAMANFVTTCAGTQTPWFIFAAAFDGSATVSVP